MKRQILIFILSVALIILVMGCAGLFNLFVLSGNSILQASPVQFGHGLGHWDVRFLTYLASGKTVLLVTVPRW